ncbi:MAG: hypothetical protein JO250_11835 [Armatimonadetes bacterium]|nr:hypothetical protein [Armatimonadota bacterium]
MAASPASTEVWPALPLEAWRETYATLHMWTQVVGKVRLALAPPINHWWQVTFYVTPRGLTTSLLHDGTRAFQIGFDFLDHRLRIETAEGRHREIALKPQSVADFYRETLDALRSLDVGVSIWPVPVEVPDPVPFAQDQTHHAYDPEYAQRFWRILVQTERVFTDFRARFLGKVSPVHFFWGSFDLAVTRFSGRPAPPHPGAPGVADRVTREAYSHEVSSAGFWPGEGVGFPAFYSYAYPEPEGFGQQPVQPAQAYYDQNLREFLLPYDAVRAARSPDEALLAFLQSAYEAEANLARWDRTALERDSPAS